MIAARVGEHTGAAAVACVKPNPARSKAIEVRRFVVSAAVTTQIGPAQIVGDNDDDVDFLGGKCRESEQQHANNRGNQVSHVGLKRARKIQVPSLVG